MAGLDYFLNTKWVERISKSNATNLYVTNIPSTVTSRFNFNFKNQIEQDRYLYDYLNAYRINSDSKTIKEWQQLEILSLLILDGNLEHVEPLILKQKIFEIFHGRRPESKDERKIWNLIEVMNLIHKEKFEINENNFELFIHIIFRNIGYDLDSKQSYYRNNKTKSCFKNLADILSIDQELETLMNYIKNLTKKDISGFTQVYLVMLDFIFISPYKEFNLIIGYLLMKWFLLKFAPDTYCVISLTQLSSKWNEFVNAINQSFSDSFNLDEPLRLLRCFSQTIINICYRLSKVNALNLKEKKKETNLIINLIDKVILVKGLSYWHKPLTVNSLKIDFTIRNVVLMSEIQITKILDKWVQLEIMSCEQIGANKKYNFQNKELDKLRILLKD